MNTPLPQKQVPHSSRPTFLRLTWDHPKVLFGIGLLPSILSICCLVGEIAAALGFLAAIVMIPFSQTRVANGRESIRINVAHGTFDGGCNVLFGGSPNSAGANSQPRGNASDIRFGSLSIGPLRLRAEREPEDSAAEDVSVQDVEGVVTIMHPANAALALAFVRWPFILSLLCTGATSVVLLDLFRRMLRSVAKREVFTTENLRNVYLLGILFIASSVAKLFLAGWLVNRFVAFVELSVPHGKAALESASDGDGSGIGIGLMILVLAGVFRQGLALKEDNQLTI